MNREGWIALFWSWFLRFQAATWRVRSEGLEELDAALAAGRPLLAGFWHGKYPALFPLLRGRDAVIFSSTSRRGTIIAEICRRFGYRGIPIPDRGKERSLGIMRKALEGAVLGALAVDGPLGPRHRVKRGAVVLASEQDRAIVPITVAASRKKVAEKRWDKMEFPRPFSRVALVVGEFLQIPGILSAEEEGRWRRKVQDALFGVDARAEEIVNAD